MNNDDPLVVALDKPTPELLERLTSDFSSLGSGDELWARQVNADAVRYCTWAGQSVDGKKHKRDGVDPFPWENASDTRPMAVDATINELVTISWNAFWKAILSGKAGSSESSAYAVALLDYLVNDKLLPVLTDEVELSAQYLYHYGWVVLHPCWVQEVSLKKTKVAMSTLVGVGAQLAPQYPTRPELADLQGLVLDESQEALATDALRFIYDTYAAQQMPPGEAVEIPPIKDRTLKRAIKELRKDGETTVPVPYLCRNEPMVYALQPWVEVLLPSDTTDLQDARVIFQREVLTEATLRSRIVGEGYDATWVDEAVKSGKNMFSVVPGFMSPTTGVRLSGDVFSKSERIEIVHATYRAVDEDDVPGIYCTTFSPVVTKGKDSKALYAKHELIDYPHGSYPFVLGKRENIARAAVASRGVPEVALTWQHEEKALRDAEIDLTSIGVVPPVNVYKDPKVFRYKFAPAAQNFVQLGKEPKFEPIPLQGFAIAEAALERLEFRRCSYFGTFHKEIAPEALSARITRTVQRFLVTWVSAFHQVLALSQKYMADAEFARVTGAPEGWLESRRDSLGLLTAGLSFDVRELSDEMTLKMIEIVNEAIIPSDVTGTIQRAKWPAMALRMLKPAWAKELVVSSEEASQSLYNQVNNDLMSMFLGNAPQLVENDPTAKAKMQFAEQIVQQNKNYQAALQQQGPFAEQYETYIKNLGFSVQQEENKKTGRVGVPPQQ